MAALITVKGLLRCGQQAFESTNYDAARNIQVGSVDDSSNALADSDTAANSGGAVSNFYDQVFDSTPTESTTSTTATITTTWTVPTGSGNFTIRRILMHDDTAANVTSSSSTLFGGIDGQSLTKTSDFTIQFTLKTTFTDAS